MCERELARVCGAIGLFDLLGAASMFTGGGGMDPLSMLAIGGLGRGSSGLSDLGRYSLISSLLDNRSSAGFDRGDSVAQSTAQPATSTTAQRVATRQVA